MVSESYCVPLVVPASSMVVPAVAPMTTLPPNVTLAGLFPGFRSPSNSVVPPPVKVPAPLTSPKKTVRLPRTVRMSPLLTTSS